MDQLDLSILKTLMVNNGVPPGNPVLRKSLRSIARELKVDQGTVRSRMKKFQETGVLKGWYLGVSPGVTDHYVASAWFIIDDQSAKTELAERLLSLPNVERVCNYLGPKISLVLLYKKGTSPDPLLKTIEKLAGPDRVLYKREIVQVLSQPLKQMDSEIIGCLRKDPWKPHSSIAKELGLSARTVKRRVTRLSEDGTIYSLPIINLKAFEGVIPMELIVGYEPLDSRHAVNKRIKSHIGDALVFSDTSGPYGYFAIVVPNIANVEKIANWVTQQNGVKDVHSDALQEVYLNQTHYEEWNPSNQE